MSTLSRLPDQTLEGLQFGVVCAQDYLSYRVKVRLDEFDGLESWWLKVPVRHAKGSKSRPVLPAIGEHGAAVLQRDGVNGVYLGGIYSTAEAPPVTDDHTEYVRFSDGTVISYDLAGHVLAVDCVGATTLKCGQGLSVETGAPVVVKAPSAFLDIPQVAMKGNLEVDGNIHATGTIIDEGGNTPNHNH